MRPPTSTPAGLGRAALTYLAATGVSVVGTAFGLLGATGAATAAGGSSHGALASGIFLASTTLIAAVAVPSAPRLCRHLSLGRAYACAQAVNALAYLIAGVALLMGAPTILTLLAAAPLIGVTSGANSVLRPLLSKAFMGSDSTARACATMAVVNGVAWGVGGLAGGMLLSHVAFGWGLVVNAGLTTGLMITVSCVAPASEPSTPRTTGRAWPGVWAALAGHPRLRWTAVLGASSVLFLAPAASLVVPIAQDLRQRPEVTGAGLLLAAFAVGELVTPWTVRMLKRHREDLPAGALAGTIAGSSLLVLGVLALVLTRRVELAAWLIVGLAFGAFRFAARSLFIGSAAESGPPDDAAANLAAATTVALFAAPLGLLVSSLVIDAVSAGAAVLLGGAGAVAVGMVILRVSRAIPGAAAGVGS